MPHKEDLARRDPEDVQAWLIGGGIASLAAAVHLIKDANMPARNVHVLDMHKGAGGAMQSSGDAVNGYMLRTGCLPYIHDICVEDLLSHVPSPKNPDQSIMDSVRELADDEILKAPSSISSRLLAHGVSGPEKVNDRQFHLGFKHRFELIKLMVEGEKAVADKTIKDLFDESFFSSKFWTLWSTTFAFRPEHGAVEFQRHVRKYLERIKDFNNVSALDRTQYTPHESVILPIASYLKSEGVDFRFHAKVTDLIMYPEGDPTTISEIEMIHDDNNPSLITVDPIDIVIITLGSVSSGTVVGSNDSPPPSHVSSKEIMIGDWSLWNKLSVKSTRKFGDPLAFCDQIDESKVETFTVTLRDSKFLALYEKLTHDRPGSRALLSFVDSNWNLSISVPRQPLFSNQPDNVHVIWGYGMDFTKPGNYVQKPMPDCTGEEILTEVLGHLNFPPDEILPTAITSPCVMPLATASMVKRNHYDRPEVIPPNTTNMAFVGQFTEIPHDTTFSMEYSVRGAQMAVYNLMGLSKHPPPVKTNVLQEVFGLLS